MPSSEGAEEFSFCCELEELIAGEPLAGTIDLNVVVTLELKNEGSGLCFAKEEGFDLQDDGFFSSGGLESGEKVLGEGIVDGFLMEGELAGEGAGVSGTAFKDHFPNGVEVGFVLPRESPEVFFGDPFFGKAAVEIEGDDIEAALREDEEAVISPAPSGGVHAGAGGIGTDEEGHAMAVAADVGLGFSFVVALEVEEIEAVFGAF